jgi:PIN domain nuclease of toxin-antitoxin system
VRLLLDTHVLLWALDEPDRLNASFIKAIQDPGNDVFFSAVSIWELAIKASSPRMDLRVRPQHLAEAARMTGFEALSLTPEVAARVALLPHHHGDPFDRVLVAQAQAMPARLLTCDAVLEQYGELIWLEPRRG